MKFSKSWQDAIRWGKYPANWSNIGFYATTTCLVKLPLQCSGFWWRTKLQQTTNYLIHQISLHATSVTSQGPRPDSNVIILLLQKIFNRILQHFRAISKDNFQRHFQQWRDCWSQLYVQKDHSCRVNELHFIQVHFSMDYDHVTGTIQSSHTTHSSTCL